MSRQEQSHSDGPENNSCQKIEITGYKKMPYNHDYCKDVERRSDTMKRLINWVHMRYLLIALTRLTGIARSLI